MQAGHSAAEASPEQVERELRDLARLHTGLRRGQASVLHQAQLDSAALDRQRASDHHQPELCTLAPSGAAAACLVRDCSSSDEEGDDPASTIYVARHKPGTGDWLSAISKPAGPFVFTALASGWGERFFGVLSRRPHEAQLCARVYDSQQGCWGRDLLIKARGEPSDSQPVRFCEGDHLAAGLAYGLSAPGVAGLVIWGVQQRSVHIARGRHMCTVRWLPGTASLLVMGSSCLARLDVDVAALPAEQELELQWVDVPAADDGAILCLVPGAASVVLVQSSRGSAGPANVTLSAFDTSDMVTRAVWSREVGPPAGNGHHTWDLQGRHSAVCCSRTRIAFCLNQWGCELHVLANGILGKRLLWAEGLDDISFSKCGYALCGIRQLKDVCEVVVIEARSGVTLAVLKPASLFTGCLSREGIYPDTVAWTAAGHLLHTALPSDDSDQVLLSETAFGR